MTAESRRLNAAILEGYVYTEEQMTGILDAAENETPYQCTWSQTGYAYGVYVNNGEHCETCGTLMMIDSSCPRCKEELPQD
jgi:hypothetical protein